MTKKGKSPLDRAIGKDKQFTPARKDFHKSDCFKTLGNSAKALYYDLCNQYKVSNGSTNGNNGDLTIGFRYMQKNYGWKSSDTLTNAKNELLERKILIVSRKQRFKRDTILYALSTYAIDFVLGDNNRNKHDLKPTGEPPDTWQEWKPPPKNK